MDYLQKAKRFRTKKRLGQNFLINSDVINSIPDYVNLTNEDTVLEIGPGIGFVTELLVKKAKKVIAVEIDKEAIYELKKIKTDNLTIIENDILKTDISELTDEKIKIVANIPYYITTPILVHLLGEIDDLCNKNRNKITDIVLMVQEEVARRITATEKSNGKQYGLLSILSQFWSDCEIVKIVGRRSFYPSPKVNSALVKFKIRQKPLLDLTDYKHFRKIIKSAFAQRRKNIKNCLLSGGFDKELIINSLNRLNISENERGENLSIETLGKLSEEMLANAKN